MGKQRKKNRGVEDIRFFVKTAGNFTFSHLPLSILHVLSFTISKNPKNSEKKKTIITPNSTFPDPDTLGNIVGILDNPWNSTKMPKNLRKESRLKKLCEYSLVKLLSLVTTSTSYIYSGTFFLEFIIYILDGNQKKAGLVKKKDVSFCMLRQK